jgi:hypothetical protein
MSHDVRVEVQSARLRSARGCRAFTGFFGVFGRISPRRRARRSTFPYGYASDATAMSLGESRARSAGDCAPVLAPDRSTAMHADRDSVTSM